MVAKARKKSNENWPQTLFRKKSGTLLRRKLTVTEISNQTLGSVPELARVSFPPGQTRSLFWFKLNLAKLVLKRFLVYGGFPSWHCWLKNSGNFTVCFWWLMSLINLIRHYTRLRFNPELVIKIKPYVEVGPILGVLYSDWRYSQLYSELLIPLNFSCKAF